MNSVAYAKGYQSMLQAKPAPSGISSVCVDECPYSGGTTERQQWDQGVGDALEYMTASVPVEADS